MWLRGDRQKTSSTSSNGVFVSGRPLLHPASSLDLKTPGQAFPGFPQRLQEEGLLVVPDDSKSFRAPLAIYGGANGVAKDVGLRLLLGQAIPERYEMVEKDNQGRN